MTSVGAALRRLRLTHYIVHKEGCFRPAIPHISTMVRVGLGQSRNRNSDTHHSTYMGCGSVSLPCTRYRGRLSANVKGTTPGALYYLDNARYRNLN